MKKRIAIINYGMGNLRSVENAVKQVGADVRIVTSPDEVGEADGLVLPGVGALQDCIEGLVAAKFPDFLKGWVAEERPLLGVCLGLQAMFERSEERDVKGLGLFAGEVKRFKSRPGLKIPHMGWNQAKLCKGDSPYWNGLDDEQSSFYFVHSYYVAPEDESLILTTTDYEGVFTSSISKGNTLACQFHPEKSQSNGLRIYANFVDNCKNRH
ncbi:imidazole glycerol phosphate synthase subunit HisH [Puniceicoccaceae bacterium K14]|nr:imidazole glycerol phosphate synthase subunit HisH [Puniceicoccaceae bacterium K14]